MTAALLLYLLIGINQPKIDMSVDQYLKPGWAGEEMGRLEWYAYTLPCGCDVDGRLLEFRRVL